MGDGGQIIRPLPHLGIAHPVLAVVGLQAQLPGDLQPQFQGLGRTFAKGHSGLFLPHHAVNGHQAANVPEDVLLVFFHKVGHIPHQFLIHICFLPISISVLTIPQMARFCKHIKKDARKPSRAFSLYLTFTGSPAAPWASAWQA